MAHQYVYTMHRLTKHFPPDRDVLKEVTLAFLPGAKIGVLGYNGAGKSTLLRIMAGRASPHSGGEHLPAPAAAPAGRHTDYRGDAQLAPGATVGLLEQEPELDEAKDVRGNVETGLAHLRDMLDRFNELSMN